MINCKNCGAMTNTEVPCFHCGYINHKTLRCDGCGLTTDVLYTLYEGGKPTKKLCYKCSKSLR